MITASRTIDGVDYMEQGRGVLLPVSLLRHGHPKVKRPEDVMRCLEKYRFEPQEHFLVVTLDSTNKAVNTHVVFIGTADKCMTHARDIFRLAILDNASRIIVAHNHPSGSLEASVDDLLATRRISEAGNLMAIPLMDHMILSPEGWVSLREKFPDYFSGRAAA